MAANRQSRFTLNKPRLADTWECATFFTDVKLLARLSCLRYLFLVCIIILCVTNSWKTEYSVTQRCTEGSRRSGAEDQELSDISGAMYYSMVDILIASRACYILLENILNTLARIF